jgi:hypothetical protein
MNIVCNSFINNIKLAICIYPCDILKHRELKELMIDYTSFYAYRLKEVSRQLDILYANSIDQALKKYKDQYNHILFIAAGVRIYNAKIIIDIAKEIDSHPNYLAAAHVLDWKDNGYELHHQFVLVNVINWKKINCPTFGNRQPKQEELIVVERSVENFHDDYTPLWIRGSNRKQLQWHRYPGWNFINSAFQNDLEIINWNQTIRNNRTYYYPETDSDLFFKAFKNRRSDAAITNFNQHRILSELETGVSDQIWAINSEHMHVQNKNKKYEKVILPASGFKYLDVFKSNALTNNGKIIIYDYNPKSLAWIKHIHSSTSNDITELIRTFKHNTDLKWFGYDNPPIIQNNIVAKDFLDSFNTTVEFFDGKFYEYINNFRNTEVEFIQTDLVNDYLNLLNAIGDSKALLSVSNIFATDFLVGVLGLNGIETALDNFVNISHPNTRIIGQHPRGHLIK